MKIKIYYVIFDCHHGGSPEPILFGTESAAIDYRRALVEDQVAYVKDGYDEEEERFKKALEAEAALAAGDFETAWDIYMGDEHGGLKDDYDYVYWGEQEVEVPEYWEI